MPIQLLKVPFSASLLPSVQDFDCGTDLWAIEVSDWLKAPIHEQDCAATSVESGRCSVWLYRHETTGELVGFGALGKTNWHWPLPTGKRVPINIIPHVAIAVRFQGEPSGAPWQERFSAQIMSHLAFEATQTVGTAPVLGLFVHEQNERAICFYERIGFGFLGDEHDHHDKVTGAVYLAMAIVLDRPAAS